MGTRRLQELKTRPWRLIPARNLSSNECCDFTSKQYDVNPSRLRQKLGFPAKVERKIALNGTAARETVGGQQGASFPQLSGLGVVYFRGCNPAAPDFEKQHGGIAQVASLRSIT